MACLLTSGRALPCKSSVGGLKAIYFADFGTLGDGYSRSRRDHSIDWYS